MIQEKLRGADYENVTLLESMYQKQRDETIETYLKRPRNEDILVPFRRKAGIDTGSARGMTGWGPSIGQYFGAYAKLWRGTGDGRIRKKALDLFHGWCECVEKDEKVLDVGTYAWEKIVGGLNDMAEFMDMKEEIRPWITRLICRGDEVFEKDIPRDGLQDARMLGQIEWYTLPENLYRAWQIFGDERFRQMADEWLYSFMWDKIAEDDFNIGPRHAYSHVNSLSSAARAYMVTEDEHYLDVIRKGYEGIYRNHTYATGGYGPGETLFGEDPGYLGNALLSTWDNAFEKNQGIVYKNFGGGKVARSDAWGSCEVSCCSWAVFKLCNYLLKLTGEAKYGAWAEKMLVNGTLGQPPITEKGQVLYYASYFMDGAIKSYDDRRLQHMGQNFVWQCCTGTFPQDVAEYANMIAYFNDEGVRISQLIPSKIDLTRDGAPVSVEIKTDFPKSGKVRLSIRSEKESEWTLSVRVPEWAKGDNCAYVNGERIPFDAGTDEWFGIHRVWHDGDKVEVNFPYALRFVPVDREHPELVALCYGPEVLVSDEMTVLVGDREHPEEWIRKTEDGLFETLPGHTGIYDFVCRTFRPYWTVGLMKWYYMYNRIYPDMETLDREHQGF